MSGFREAGATPMPRLACIGKVAEIPEAFVSKSEVYVVQRVHLDGYGPSRNIKPMLLYRADWFTDGFDPESLNELQDGHKLLSVYRNNIAEHGKISVLKGFCGCDDDKFNELAGRIFGLGITAESSLDDVLPDVNAVLTKFLIDEQAGDSVGYILGQQSSKTDMVDPESGKTVWVNEPYYEVKEFFNPHDQKRIATLYKAANKSDGKFKITFDATPF